MLVTGDNTGLADLEPSAQCHGMMSLVYKRMVYAYINEKGVGRNDSNTAWPSSLSIGQDPRRGQLPRRWDFLPIVAHASHAFTRLTLSRYI